MDPVKIMRKEGTGNNRPPPTAPTKQRNYKCYEFQCARDESNHAALLSMKKPSLKEKQATFQ